jgi:anti-sigma B factor antagonist
MLGVYKKNYSVAGHALYFVWAPRGQPWPQRNREHVLSDFAARTTESGVVVVQPTGRLNMASAPTLRKQLSDIVDGGGTRIVVDLSATDFIDSSGLGALISTLKIARKAGGDLRIAAPTRQVCTVLELSNLDRVLRAYDSVDSAFDD